MKEECSLTLQNGISESDTGPTLKLSLSLVDLNEIKRMYCLCVSQDTCLLSVTSDLVLDSAGFPLVEIVPSDPRGQGGFIEDVTSPTLQA